MAVTLQSNGACAAGKPQGDPQYPLARLVNPLSTDDNTVLIIEQ